MWVKIMPLDKIANKTSSSQLELRDKVSTLANADNSGALNYGIKNLKLIELQLLRL